MAEDKIGENPHLYVVIGINRTWTSFHNVEYFFRSDTNLLYNNIPSFYSFFFFSQVDSGQLYIYQTPSNDSYSPHSFLPPLFPSLCPPGLLSYRAALRASLSKPMVDVSQQ
jgi:hypothetical protein